MAGSYNKCILMGNVVRDPEIRYTANARAVCKFTLAVNNPRNKEETTFVDLIAWERLADICSSYLKKGACVLVEGRLVIRSYETKEGDKRKATEVVIDNMQMVGGKDVPDEDREYATASARKKAEPDGPTFGRPGKAEPEQSGFYDDIEDEIPFRWRQRCKANIAEGTVTAGCHYRRTTNTRKWVTGI